MFDYDKYIQDDDAEFEPGKTYYSYFELFTDEGTTVSPDFTAEIEGGEFLSKRIEEFDWGTVVDVVFSVTIPEVCHLSAMTSAVLEDRNVFEGAFFVDAEPYWTELIDLIEVTAGPHADGKGPSGLCLRRLVQV